MNQINHFINGKYVATGDEMDSSYSPLTGDPICIFPIGRKEAVNLAAKAADTAFPIWSQMEPNERISIVSDFIEKLEPLFGEEGKKTEAKKAISNEVGKPFSEAEIEVMECVEFSKYFCEEAKNFFSIKELKLDREIWPTKQSFVHFVPEGPIAIIKPWNYPLEMIFWSLIPALLCGNTVIIKPSEKSPYVVNLIAKILAESNFPKGTCNILYGDSETGKILVEHPSIKMVAFTGSSTAGAKISKVCGERNIRSSLELSGIDAAIVLEDANLELVANGLTWGAFCNAGQVCVGIKRAFILKQVYESVKLALIKRIEQIKPLSDVGPLIDSKQFLACQKYVETMEINGAKIIAQGSKVDCDLYYPPTLMEVIEPTDYLHNQECFGPVIPITPVESIQEAIDLTKDSSFGLGASIWTADPNIALNLAKKLGVGMVWMNDVNIAFPEAPWGGVKKSGRGFELSGDVFREYTRPSHICLETSNETRRFWWYPY